MTAALNLTPAAKQDALNRRKSGETWRAIAAAFEVSVDALRRSVDEVYRARYYARNVGMAERRRAYSERCGRVDADVPPPSDVLFERDRAYSKPPSLMQLVCGDPLPGRSALDRMAR